MTQYFIYKLACDNCDFIYVGSTKSIKDRKYQHKRDSETSELKVYRMIREYGGWENWRMVILEECDENVETRRQAEMREEVFRLKLKADLNSQRAYRSEEDRKEYQKEYDKERNQRPERKEYEKEYAQRPERKAYMKEYDKERNQRPERKEYDKERNQRPEYKEYQKEYAQRAAVKEHKNAQARERRRLKKEAKNEYIPSSSTSCSSSCTSISSLNQDL